MIPDGQVEDSGEVLELVPHRRLVLSWRSVFMAGLRDEIPTRLTYELEPEGDAVKLTLIHKSELPDSKLIEALSSGWPASMASLKSLLETGEWLEATRRAGRGGHETRERTRGETGGHTPRSGPPPPPRAAR